MFRFGFLIFCSLSLAVILPAQDRFLQPHRDAIESLLQRMTLEEKVGQMTQVTVDVILEGQPYAPATPVAVDREKLRQAVIDYKVGSILNTPSGILLDRGQWRDILGQIHQMSTETRLNIPVLYGTDAVHGLNYCAGATLFPQPLGVASTWNAELAEQMAEVTAYESRAAGLPWNFSPALDVSRNPAWPRVWESYGEDTYMNQLMGRVTVQGYQGDDPADPERIAACLKHFTGYGMPLSGKDRTPAWIPERYLREYYLPPYEAAIEAGALSIMVNSGEINGVPAHASKELLTDILRGEMGFTGLLVSDWSDIIYLHTRHRVAESPKEAVRIAVEAGLDMSMTPVDYSFADLLLELVREGTIPESRIDTSVRRILGVKFALGLFDQRLYPPSRYPAFGSQAHRALSQQAAAESIVLLKNADNILPLPDDARLFVTGPAANSMRSLNGGWTGSWQGELAEDMLAEYPTILEALQEKHDPNLLVFDQAVSWDEPAEMQRSMGLANSADYILLCLGENSYTEDAGNLNDLSLSADQMELARAMLRAGKPLILVLAQGRPRLLDGLAEQSSAILAAFLPGPYGGKAVADLLFGDVNPSGRLAITYPKYPNSLVTYDHKFTEDREVMSSGPSYNPEFEFGHGLSYTTFAYSDLELDKTSYGASDNMVVRVTLSNTGDRAGKEVVQVYVSDLYASITPPVRRLRGFQKVALQPGESETVTFIIELEELAFVGRDEQWVLEPGAFRISVGGLSQEFSVEDE